MANCGVSQYSILSQLPFSHTLSLLPCKTHLTFPTIQLPKLKLLYLHVKTRTGLSVFVSKTPAKREVSPPEAESFDFDDEFDEIFEEEEEEEEEDEDEDEDNEDEFASLRNTKEWRRNKPRGFGEGKVYDTSIEDKLLEEIEQSRRAQAANLQNLKNKAKKQNLQKQKASEVVPSGIRVRLFNLPKKKNIHRDLQAAFKEFPRIISITPEVSGNKKTRDPVCKGYGFVDFNSEEDANRFVEMFSGESITFGRIKRKIKCGLVKSSPSIPKQHQPDTKIYQLPLLPNASLEIKSNLFLDTRNASLASFTNLTTFDDHKNEDEDLVPASEEFNEENLGNLDSFAANGDDNSGDMAPTELESATNAESLKKQKDSEKKKKKKKMDHVSASKEFNDKNLGNPYSSAANGDDNSVDMAPTELESATNVESSKKQKKDTEKKKKKKMDHVSASEEFNEENLGNPYSFAANGGDNSGDMVPTELESVTNAESSKKQKDAEKKEKKKMDHVSASEEFNEESLRNLGSFAANGDDNSGDMAPTELESTMNAESSKKQKKDAEKKKKTKAKREGGNAPKVKLPASAKRLRVKERSILFHVFSKYSENSSAASKGPS